MARTKDFNEDEVLAKAVTLFWHKGYNGTSMQDLVDGLGISRSSLYDTYGDKHALFVKALESYKASSSGELCNIISNTVSAKEAVKKLFEFTTRALISDQQHKGCFMVNTEVEVAPHDEQVATIICQNEQQVEDAFYHAIKKGQESGEISSEKDARALARFIFNTVKGLRVSAKSTTDESFFDDVTRTAMSVLD